MMRVLAIDCASAGCGVCVMEDGSILAASEEKMQRGQDGVLVPLIEKTLEDAKLSYEELDLIAAIKGPGSFTGLRIALATARGIALAAEKPVVGLSRFDIFYAQHKDAGKDLLIVLDSRRADFYARLVHADGSGKEPMLLTQEDVAAYLAGDPQLLLVTDIADFLPRGVDKNRVLKPTEMEALTCARLALEADTSNPAFAPQPFYLRAPDVTIKLEETCA